MRAQSRADGNREVRRTVLERQYRCVVYLRAVLSSKLACFDIFRQRDARVRLSLCIINVLHTFSPLISRSINVNVI